MKLKNLFAIILLTISVSPSASWADDEADQRLDSIISNLDNWKDDAVRGYAAYQLGNDYKGNEKAFNALVTALDREFVSYPRRMIIEALGGHENPKAFEPLKNRLEQSYNPKLCEYFDFGDVYTIEVVFDALSKIKNPLAVDYLLTYVSRQPDKFNFTPEWWNVIPKTHALRAMLKLHNLLTEDELRSLFVKHKSLLRAKSTGSNRYYYNEESIDKFAPQTAWFFLNVLESAEDVDTHTEIVTAMARDWPSEWRQTINTWLEQKPLTTIVRGTLDGQGRYIGRLGQFMLKDSSGRDISQVVADPSRHNDIYRHHGQEVLVRTEIKMKEYDTSWFKPWKHSYTLFLEFQGFLI